jgi:ParB family chromosome partitioning protein
VEDVKRLRSLRRGTVQHKAESHEPQQTPALPAKLMDELMAHKTLALRAELARQPDLALRLLVFTLASEALAGWRNSCLGVRVEHVDVSRSITRCESPAANEFQGTFDSSKAALPEDAQELWDFTGGDQHSLLALLAVLIAPSLDLRAVSKPHGGASQPNIGEIVAAAAGLDMSQYWSARPESFFEHVRRPVIVEALLEAKPTLDRAKLLTMPKSELTARAERIFKDRSWLPEPLRTHSALSAPAVAIAAE